MGDVVLESLEEALKLARSVDGALGVLAPLDEVRSPQAIAESTKLVELLTGLRNSVRDGSGKKVTVTLTGDEARLLRALARVIERERGDASGAPAVSK